MRGNGVGRVRAQPRSDREERVDDAGAAYDITQATSSSKCFRSIGIFPGRPG
jgi:hypothetical protein